MHCAETWLTANFTDSIIMRDIIYSSISGPVSARGESGRLFVIFALFLSLFLTKLGNKHDLASDERDWLICYY